MSASARWYAPDEIVPTVPMTPTRFDCDVNDKARAPGSTTLTTGTGNSADNSVNAAADAVLHATTIAFTL
jgi:hypothetical protein